MKKLKFYLVLYNGILTITLQKNGGLLLSYLYLDFKND